MPLHNLSAHSFGCQFSSLWHGAGSAAVLQTVADSAFRAELEMCGLKMDDALIQMTMPFWSNHCKK